MLTIKINPKKQFAIISLVIVIIYINTLTLWAAILPNNYVRTFFYAIIVIGVVLFWVKRKSIDEILLLFIVYLIYCFINAIIAGNGKIIDSCYAYIITPLLFLGGVYYFNASQVQLKIWMKLWTVLGTIISLLSIYEYITRKYFIPRINGVGFIFRSYVFADSCLTLGMILATTSVLGIGLFSETRKNIYLVFTILCLTGTLCTLSRGPFLSAIIAIIWIIFESNKHNIRRIVVISTIVAIIVVLLFYISLNYNLFFEGVDSSRNLINRVFSTLDWENSLGTGSGRLQKWKIYLSLFFENPFLGHGVGYLNVSSYGVTESGILMQLVEIGLIGTMLYYGSIVLVFKKVLSTIKIQNNVMVLSCLAAVLCILIENVILQIFTSTIVSACLWLLIAMLYSESSKCVCKLSGIQ